MRTAVFTKGRVIAVAVVALMLLGTGGTALAVKVRNDNSAEERRAAKVAAEREDAEAEAAEEARVEAARAERVAAKKEAERVERALRRSLVRQMEKSITKDAKEQVAEGVLTGPIFYTTCTPLGGGSTDDLTALTTTFECLAVNDKNAGNGTVRGWVFSATANWDEGSWTWRLGRS